MGALVQEKFPLPVCQQHHAAVVPLQTRKISQIVFLTGYMYTVLTQEWCWQFDLCPNKLWETVSRRLLGNWLGQLSTLWHCVKVAADTSFMLKKGSTLTEEILFCDGQKCCRSHTGEKNKLLKKLWTCSSLWNWEEDTNSDTLCAVRNEYNDKHVF